MTELLKAELFGFMLGDGWITTKYNCGFSGDPESLQIAKDDLIELYGDIGKATIVTKHTVSEKYGIEGTTSSFVCNTKIAKEFESLGMPIGKRVEQDFDIPNWILNGSNEIKAAFLSGLYAAEGYTPCFQKNNKTLKTLGFNISKRQSVEHTLHIQLGQILNDLGIKYALKIEQIQTCDWNNKYRFDFSNSNENVLLITSLINPRYCIEKQDLIRRINCYYTMKQNEISRLQQAYNYSLEHKEISARQCAEQFNIKQSQVENWRRRKTGVQLPKSFPTFNEYCPL